MSTFGLIVLLFFLLLTGGLVSLEYSNNGDLGLSRFLMFFLYLLVFAEFIIAIFEFPAYVIDGIVFLCMGIDWLAQVMFGLFAAIIIFILVIICVRIKWRSFLEVSYGKLIICGILLIGLFAMTEVFGGVYSFDSYEEYREVRNEFEEYDDHFWPTKYISHYSNLYERDLVSVYPFDVTNSHGHLDFVYRADIYISEGSEQEVPGIYFYPFTWKQYEGVKPVLLSEAVPLPDEEPPVSPADVSGTDTSGADIKPAAES